MSHDLHSTPSTFTSFSLFSTSPSLTSSGSRLITSRIHCADSRGLRGDGFTDPEPRTCVEQASLRSASAGKPRIKVIDEVPVACLRFGATVLTQAQQDVRSSSPCCKHAVRSNSVEIAPTSKLLNTSFRCHQRVDSKAIIVVVLVIVLTAAGIV